MKKSVQFVSNLTSTNNNKKRNKNDDDDDDVGSNYTNSNVDRLPDNTNRKRKLTVNDDVKKDRSSRSNNSKRITRRMNEDELDDIDEWDPNEDGDDDDDINTSTTGDTSSIVIRSEKMLLEAKRERRTKRIIGNSATTTTSNSSAELNKNVLLLDEEDDDENENDDDDVANDPIGSNNNNNNTTSSSSLSKIRKTRGIDEDDTTTKRSAISKYSLLHEDGMTNIEPFHMENERNDGSGYFDGDTYIFRRRRHDDDDGNNEPDAWLDSLNNNDNEGSRAFNSHNQQEQQQQEHDRPTKLPSESGSSEAMLWDTLSELELYTRLLPHLQQQQQHHTSANNNIDNDETVMNALVRYGNIFQKRNYRNNSNSNRNHLKNRNKDLDTRATSLEDDTTTTTTTTTTTNDLEQQRSMAQESFNIITQISNALLLKGKIDIYDTKRSDIERIVAIQSKALQQQQGDISNSKTHDVSNTSNNNGGSTTGTTVRWEYQGNQDGQIHGPYTTQEMLNWYKAGYFVGSMAVQVRTITDHTTNQPNANDRRTLTKEDLLSDLLDDDDDDDNNEGNINHNTQEIQVQRSEWMRSDTIDFTKYI